MQLSCVHAATKRSKGWTVWFYCAFLIEHSNQDKEIRKIITAFLSKSPTRWGVPSNEGSRRRRKCLPALWQKCHSAHKWLSFVRTLTLISNTLAYKYKINDYMCITSFTWYMYLAPKKCFYNSDMLKALQAARYCVTNWCNQCGYILLWKNQEIMPKWM